MNSRATSHYYNNKNSKIKNNSKNNSSNNNTTRSELFHLGIITQIHPVMKIVVSSTTDDFLHYNGDNGEYGVNNGNGAVTDTDRRDRQRQGMYDDMDWIYRNVKDIMFRCWLFRETAIYGYS